mmetsp:Transcript_25441/g.77230  ORF Transcript_25441/g.77230 Transcript_25441/m.77230 type:complete len:146 (-) Transcript_25441:1545-1982(-)
MHVLQPLLPPHFPGPGDACERGACIFNTKIDRDRDLQHTTSKNASGGGGGGSVLLNYHCAWACRWGTGHVLRVQRCKWTNEGRFPHTHLQLNVRAMHPAASMLDHESQRVNRRLLHMGCAMIVAINMEQIAAQWYNARCGAAWTP